MGMKSIKFRTVVILGKKDGEYNQREFTGVSYKKILDAIIHSVKKNSCLKT